MGASIAGAVKGESAAGSYATRSASTGLVVRLVGTSIEAAVDGSGHFELANVPDGDAHLQFAGPNVNAFATIDGVAAQEHIEVVVTLLGDTAAVETTDRSTPAEEKISGSVDALAGVCPTLTFSLSGSSIIVGPSTIFGGGSNCASVKNGDKRTAVGTRDGNRRLVARYLTGAEPPAPVPTPSPTPPTPTPPSPAPPSPAPTTLSGIITGVAGSCPTLTFSVEGTSVTTSQATTYGGGGSCADVKNGDKRYVSGTMQNGKLAATYISGAIAQEVTLSGAVASMSGTCPALSFVLSGKTVITTSTTTFSPGSCSDVKNNVTVTVVGTVGTDGRVTAKSVSVPKGDPEVTLNGVIAGLTGACPNLTFTVGGSPVATSSATTYGGSSSCASVKNGEKRYAVGPRQADGSVLARYISGVVTP